MRASEQFRFYTSSPIKYIVQFFIQNSLKEIPFEELGKYVQEIKTGKTPSKSQNKYWDSQDYNWFKPEDIGFDIYLEDSNDKISYEAVKENQATIYSKNTLLITGIGDLGRLGILKKESSSNQQITGVLFNNKVLSEFAYFYLLSIKDQLDEKSSQTTLPILNQKNLSSINMRIPAINAFLVYYSQKEIASISNKNESLISSLRQQILQDAVQGKLVPQNPSDEPASELLKKIKAEKDKLIREGKLKKQKPLAPISPDEIPYELPRGWEWVRLGDIIISDIGGGTPSKNKLEYWDGGISWASVKDLNEDTFLTKTQDNISELGLKNSSSNLIPKDNLIICTRMGLGKILFNKIDVAINQDLRAIFLPKNMERFYFYYFYKTLSFIHSGTTVSGIRREKLLDTFFPLPPLPEQTRIVEKVDKFMAYCDELEKQIKENQENSEKLMGAVLKESFENG